MKHNCTALFFIVSFKGELNNWIARLIYGILSLILGSMVLLLPETKKIPLPRTMLQVESLPTSISNKLHRQRLRYIKRNVQSAEKCENKSIEKNLVSSDMRSSRPYDNQSTLHSIYELQEIEPAYPSYLMTDQYSSRRINPHDVSFSRSNRIYSKMST